MDKLEKLRKIIEIVKKDTVSPDVFKESLVLLFNNIKQVKKELIETNNNYIAEIEKIIDSALLEVKTQKNDFKSNVAEIKSLLNEIKNIKATPGKDGKDYVLTDLDKFEIASLIEVPIVEKVVEKVEIQQEITGEEIVDKINELPLEDNKKIDAKHIKNLPEQVRYYAGNSGIKDAIDGSGTTNEIAYFTDANTLSSLSTTTYPSLTELSYVKGVTSAIQGQIDNKIRYVAFYYDTKQQYAKTSWVNVVWQATSYENGTYVQKDGTNNKNINVVATGNYIIKFQATVKHNAGIGNNPVNFEIRLNGSTIEAARIIEQRGGENDSIFTLSYETQAIACGNGDTFTVLMQTDIDDNYELYESGSGNFSTTLKVEHMTEL